jgi:hypothetical protein
MRTPFAVVIAVTCLLCPAGSSAQTSTLHWHSTATGFGISSSPTSIVKSMVGQGFIGTMQGTSTTIQSGFLADSFLRNVATSVAEAEDLPAEFRLLQNYPNPFNPTTMIKFQLPAASTVRLVVYDVLGREVTLLVNGQKEAGSYSVRFDARHLSGGVYVYVLQTKQRSLTGKMLLVR